MQILAGRDAVMLDEGLRHLGKETGILPRSGEAAD